METLGEIGKAWRQFSEVKQELASVKRELAKIKMKRDWLKRR
jgi:hypothetical protein